MSLALTKEELDSTLWKKLRAHAEGRLAICRKLNDIPRPDNETHALRGEIKTLKNSLKLDPKWKE